MTTQEELEDLIQRHKLIENYEARSKAAFQIIESSKLILKVSSKQQFQDASIYSYVIPGDLFEEFKKSIENYESLPK